MSYPLYAVYLLPSPALLYALTQAHQVLAATYNATAARRFAPHCTIKGFTKLAPGATPEALIPALDAIFAHTPAFPTEIYPPWVSSSGSGGESVLLWLKKSPAFLRLHAEVWNTLLPFIAHDCPFTPEEPAGPNFPPHITLVQYQLPGEPGLLAQGLELCRHIFETLPGRTFVARDLQLVEFQSADWEGAWWDTLRFRQIKGWRLTEASP